MWINGYDDIIQYFNENTDEKIPVFKIGEVVRLKPDYFDIHSDYATWNVNTSDKEYFKDYENKNIEITDVTYQKSSKKIYYEINKNYWLSGPSLKTNKPIYNEPKKLVYENIKILNFNEFLKNKI